MDNKRFTFTMSKELFEKLSKQADKNKRSIAKEIEYMLEQYFNEKEKQEE